MLPIGLGESDLKPVCLDLAGDPHLLVFGDSGCGKSSFLRTLATSITRRFTPEQARIVVIDYRRTMLGEVTSEHLIGFASTSDQAKPLLDSVATYMRARLPGPDVTPAQLRARSWWTGPECFVLVDDWDLIATGPANPLGPLLDLLPQARDIGLHVIIARRSGGAARAMYEPVLARLRELTTPGLLMSGNKDEGPLVGTARPQNLPRRPCHPGSSARWRPSGPARLRGADRLRPVAGPSVGAGAGADVLRGGLARLDHRRRLRQRSSANPVCGSSAAAAKITPSTSPSEAISGPPEFPLRTRPRSV